MVIDEKIKAIKYFFLDANLGTLATAKNDKRGTTKNIWFFL